MKLNVNNWIFQRKEKGEKEKAGVKYGRKGKPRVDVNVPSCAFSERDRQTNRQINKLHGAQPFILKQRCNVPDSTSARGNGLCVNYDYGCSDESCVVKVSLDVINYDENNKVVCIITFSREY